MTAVLPDYVKVHPAAEIFPMMTAEALAELVADIKENGLLESITTDQDGALLDGRNRLLACEQAGVEPRYATYKGDPWRYVVSTNLHRRHLTDAQRAVIAGKLADRLPGRLPVKASAEAFYHRPPTRSEAAQMFNVSRTALERARRIQHTGTEHLNKLVEEGRVPLSTADRVASQPSKKQDAFADRVESGVNPRYAENPKARPPLPPPVVPRRVRNAKEPNVLGKDSLQRIALDMGGIDLALKPITAIEADIAQDDLFTWYRALAKGGKALYRIRKLIKYQLNEGKQQP